MPDRPRTRATVRPPAAAQPPALSTQPPPGAPAEFLTHVRELTNQRAEVRVLREAELDRLRRRRGAAEADRPLPPRVRRQADINALQTWHSAATARLGDLVAGVTTGHPERPALTAEQQREAETLKGQLITGLSKNRRRIAVLHGAQRRWHLAVKAAAEGIELRDGTARTVLNRPLRPDAQLHLTLARARFMLEGNSPRLRQGLTAAAGEVPDSKGVAYWRARYELMAGHFSAARDAIDAVRDTPQVRSTLIPLLEPEAATAPWLSWPANFYTYRYQLADDRELRGMQELLAALSTNPELETTWTAFGIPASAIAALKDRAIDGGRALSSLLAWNHANNELEHRRYGSAVRAYQECQRTILEYFAGRYPDLNLATPEPPDEAGSDPTPDNQLEDALERLAIELIRYDAPTREIWTFFRERYMTITLDELHTHDWRRPNVVPLAYEFAAPLPDYGDSTDFGTALVRLLIQMSILKSLQNEGEKVEEKIDAPLLAIALVFCPLARAEADRLRRHYDDALAQTKRLLRRHSQFKILSEVIEKPFAKILRAQILLAKADAQYKARAMAASPATNPDGSLRFQGLEAAETYQGVLTVFEDEGQYVARVNDGVVAMQGQVSTLLQHSFHPLAGGQPPLTPADKDAFARLGKAVTIQTVSPARGDYPDADRRTRPHEPLVRIAADPGGGGPQVIAETNPQIYSLIIQARARLLQMESGLNYLGYRDDYTPPWRFQYLLDRARYFTDHAKNAEREYLNFLQNAEREEFQELTAAQNVELEKSNVRVESARVDQVRVELEVAKMSSELAVLQRDNSATRLGNYQSFDTRADEIDGDIIDGLTQSMLGAVGSGALAGASIGAAGGPWGAAAGAIIGGGFGFLSSSGSNKVAKAQLAVASEQREYEKQNLALAVGEAQLSADIADGQQDVAQAGLVVAGLQRASALMRHEFALQNLQFMRNRTLNAEMWYRLSAAIRSVADTYLRYAIELAFLAEQAYEFEADRRLDVIRFDYDVSDLGDMLAGDFLLRDLDTLEQDLIVSQRLRQQNVRYVLSLAREFPEALQELRESGSMTFALRLEQIESRFPGLFNMRIGSVEIQPLAVLDPSRFAMELTHLGSGQVRVHGHPVDPTIPTVPDWLSGLGDEWSVRLRTTGPETAVFTGPTRDNPLTTSFITANQRGAFEGLPAAGAWRVDLSTEENRVVPGSLMDVAMVFSIAGYYDATLRQAADRAVRPPRATTTWLSGHRQFPDAFYEFHRDGRMEWDVTADALALQGTVGTLRNAAVVCTSAQGAAELGRLGCSYRIAFDLDASGVVTLIGALPRVAFAVNGLALDVSLAGLPGADVTFDFGDGTGLLDSTALPHTYARPGSYEVLIRIADGGRLTEYRAAVAVSRQHVLLPPCVAVPDLQSTVVGGQVELRPALEAGTPEPLSTFWRVDGTRAADPAAPVFVLEPGRHELTVTAARPLTGRFHSRQVYLPSVDLAMDHLRLATNRTFDPGTGAETTTTLNAFGQHLFGSADALTPVDRWTFELPAGVNPALASVTANDTLTVDLGELADAFLALEYEVD